MLQSELNQYGLRNPSAVVRIPEASDRSQTVAAEEDFDLHQWAKGVARGVDKLVAAAEHGEVEDIEKAIEHLEALEEEVRRPWEMLKSLLESEEVVHTLTVQAPAGIRGSVERQVLELGNTLQDLLSPIESVLRSYRDGRWNLMAIQAEKEPPGNAPVFDDADSLLSYLKS